VQIAESAESNFGLVYLVVLLSSLDVSGRQFVYLESI